MQCYKPQSWLSEEVYKANLCLFLVYLMTVSLMTSKISLFWNTGAVYKQLYTVWQGLHADLTRPTASKCSSRRPLNCQKVKMSFLMTKYFTVRRDAAWIWGAYKPPEVKFGVSCSHSLEQASPCLMFLFNQRSSLTGFYVFAPLPTVPMDHPWSIFIVLLSVPPSIFPTQRTT